jgi:cystathionine beta-lyase/cystathionine gamma-synthase
MKKKEVNSPRMPIYRDSGFELFDAETTSEIFRQETEHNREPEKYIYSRYRNPTVVSAEEAIMEIEGSEWALLTQSGMSAIDTALSVFHKGELTRPWLFFTEIYGGTISYVESVLKKRRGLNIQYFSSENGTYDLNKLEKVLSELKTEVLYIETVSNPMLIVADITAITDLAKKHNTKVIADNTFATPALYKPLEHGVDIVIHSATKYFSGHGNLTAGVLCGNDHQIMQDTVEYRKFVGHMLSPDDAYRLQSQILTFKLRFSRQCENAFRLAMILEKNMLIEKVWYPGLVSHPTHMIAEKLFIGKGYGAMITFDFAGKNKEEKRRRRDEFMKLLTDKIKLIPTLGDPHTILMPVDAVWSVKYPEPGMIRLSVGFEEFDELEACLNKALSDIL